MEHESECKAEDGMGKKSWGKKLQEEGKKGIALFTRHVRSLFVSLSLPAFFLPIFALCVARLVYGWEICPQWELMCHHEITEGGNVLKQDETETL